MLIRAELKYQTLFLKKIKAFFFHSVCETNIKKKITIKITVLKTSLFVPSRHKRPCTRTG